MRMGLHRHFKVNSIVRGRSHRRIHMLTDMVDIVRDRNTDSTRPYPVQYLCYYSTVPLWYMVLGLGILHPYLSTLLTFSRCPLRATTTEARRAAFSRTRSRTHVRSIVL